MNMNKYPAIYKSEEGTPFLYLDKFNFYCFRRAKWQKDECPEDHKSDKNITREYLNNHAIKIESQEHLDFLYKIAKVHELNLQPIECRIFDENYPYFVTVRNIVFHGNDKLLELEDKKLITITLPPKELEPEAKPWPQVGDEVILENKMCDELKFNVKIEFISKNHIIADDKYFRRGNYKLSKPLTPEEDLKEKLTEITDKYRNQELSIQEIIAKAIIEGEIKDLSYKPE